MNPIANKTVDFTAISRESWQDKKVVAQLVTDLKAADTIITAQGVFPRIEWSSGYEDILTWHTKNEKKAKIIIEAFDETFTDLSESHQEQVKEFIKANHVFIGLKKPKFVFNRSSVAHLANPQFIAKFDLFLDKVSEKLSKVYTQQKTETNTHKTAVAILTCNAGGGHRMVAQSIEKRLQLDARYEAKVINVDEVQGDSISIVTNAAVKTYQIFSQFQCQENDHKKADLYRDMRWELHHFIPARMMDEVNQAIQGMGADIILNTIHHEVEYFSANADLALPIAFINTDYELPPQLLALRNNVQTDDFKIFTPTEYNLNIGGISAIGYPVRAGFEQVVTAEQTQAIKQKYNIADDEWLVVMQMGSLAMGVEQHLEKLLKQTQKMHKKCHFVFLCANNQPVKDAVKKANDQKTNTCVTFHAEGMLNDVELSALYQTCDAVLGKPGGATTAEIAVTNAFLLAYDPLPWERPNLEYLKARGQAVEINSFDKLNHWLSTKKKPKAAEQQPVLDWNTKILNELDQMQANQKPEEPVVVNKPYTPNKLSNLFTRYIKRALTSFRTFLQFIFFGLSYMWKGGGSGFKVDRLKTWWKYQ